MSQANQIARLRKATGMGWLDARKFLTERPAELCERIVMAHERQNNQFLHDPIEDDPAFAPQFADARRKADEAFQSSLTERNAASLNRGLTSIASKHPSGGCHFIWREMRRILLEQHGIKWFTPAEMNPGSIFD